VINDYAVAKDKLLTLTDIDAQAIKTMTNTQLLSYVQALNVTVAAFPLQKDELMHALSEMDYATLFQWLHIISSSLSQMYAEELAQECEKHIKQNQDLSTVKHERIKVFMDYFMPTLDLFFADVYKILEDIDALEIEKVDDIEEVDPGKIKEKLLTISELNSETIKSKTDDELSDYIEVINAFHTEYQAQENGLKGAIKIKHYVFVLQWLNTIEETLNKIHADELANDCRNQISTNKDFNNIRHEKLEVFVNYILSSMSMISADIKQLHLPKHYSQAAASDHPEVEVQLLIPGSLPDAKTVLLINKMTIFMNSFKNALSDFGHKLIGVTTAEAAISYLKTTKPDLFVIDEDLPSTDVYVLIKIIRATGQLAPIIFTTGKITKDKMVKFMEAGVADFIAKPITPTDVQKKVIKHLS